MPYYKMEINFEAEDESQASDIESQCYQIVVDNIGDYKKTFMDLVFEIDEDEKER